MSTDQRPPLDMHAQRWGDPRRAEELSEATRGLVEMVFGAADTPAADLATPPPSRLTDGARRALSGLLGDDHVVLDDDVRRGHTRGKSTPDLLRARSGDLVDAPDAVLLPGSHEDVVGVLELAAEHGFAVTPFGGGTSVVGGLIADREGNDLHAVVALDLRRLDRLVDVDEVSMTATLEVGLRGPQAEALLAERGLTLGHFPQSFEYASIGGFAAARSSGQSSAGYGRFDAMVVSLRAATGRGTLEVGTSPANAAGPDLRQLMLGSEGAFGVITSVRVRVRRLPAVKRYQGWGWDSFQAGSDAMRTVAQSGLMPTVIRLSDETETAVNLADPAAMNPSGSGEDAPRSACLMIVGFEGEERNVDARQAEVTALLTEAGGTPLGAEPGEKWAHGRFDAPYLRDQLMDHGVLVETLETATFWADAPATYAAVGGALRESLGEGTLVLCHVSHVYETGCSLYFTVAAPQGGDPLGRWLAAKDAASAAIRATGASISHHHGVGHDHKRWFAEEIGPVGVGVLRAVKAELDPAGVLNPGVMVP